MVVVPRALLLILVSVESVATFLSIFGLNLSKLDLGVRRIARGDGAAAGWLSAKDGQRI